MSEKRSLSFSVQGKLITDISREKLYYNNDLTGAVELLMSCLETDQLSEGDRLLIAIEILNGTKQIAGVYPSDDYRVEECEQANPEHTISAWCKRINETIKTIQQEKKELTDQLLCIYDNLSEWDRKKINTAWRTEYGGETIFKESANDDLRPLLTAIDVESDDPLADVLERFSSDTEDDYGWLSPTGEFHPEDWGNHEKFAREWLRKNDPDFDEIRCYNAGDRLTEKGWILLHNPTQGTAFVTQSETHRPTKAQREFLFDYYTERNRPDLAKKYLEEE